MSQKAQNLIHEVETELASASPDRRLNMLRRVTDLCMATAPSIAEDGLETPEDIAAAIEGHLKLALEEIGALVAELSGEADEVVLAEAAE